MTSKKEPFEILVSSVRRYINAGVKSRLWKFLSKLRPEDIARITDRLVFENKKIIFELLKEKDITLLAEVLSEIDPEDAVELLKDLSPKEISEILNEFSSDDAAELLSEFPEDLKQKVIQCMNKEESEDVKELLQYEEDTAGRIMSTDYYALEENTKVSDAIAAIQLATDVEVPFYLYVVDKDSRLTGVVSLKKLLLYPPKTKLKDIMLKDIIYVTTDTDQEEVARKVERYNLVAIPVVDKNKKLVGVITVDDVIDIIREEATEDIYRMAGVVEGERIQDPVFDSIKKRIPWLMLALLTTFFSAIVITYFEGVIKNAVILAALMPLVAALGGVAGNQTNAVVVRELSMGDFDWKMGRRLLLKHFLLGVALGILVGVGGAVFIKIAYKFLHITTGLNIGIDSKIIMIFGIGIFFNILNGLLMGTIIPMSFRFVGLDPALSSNMFVSMFTDTFGFFIFLQLAKAFYHV